jgi:hypothetical protein
MTLRRDPRKMRLAAAALAAALLLQASVVRAQAAAPPEEIMGTSKDRILWIFPNYKTVDEMLSLPHITPREKLTIAAKDSFDPYAFPIAGMFAGLSQAENQYPSWGRGTVGYQKRFVGALADQTMSNMMTEAAFPILLQQDPRYFRLGRGAIGYRAGYAVSRIFVTRADTGEAEFNYSEFGGNAVMAGTANLYYPKQDATIGNAAVRFGSQIIFDMLAAVGKEFWPDVKRLLVGR